MGLQGSFSAALSSRSVPGAWRQVISTTTGRALHAVFVQPSSARQEWAVGVGCPIVRRKVAAIVLGRPRRGHAIALELPVWWLGGWSCSGFRTRGLTSSTVL